MDVILMVVALLIPLSISGAVSYFVGATVRKKLIAADNKNAKGISILASIVSFLIVLIAIFFVLVYNFRIER